MSLSKTEFLSYLSTEDRCIKALEVYYWWEEEINATLIQPVCPFCGENKQKYRGKSTKRKFSLYSCNCIKKGSKGRTQFTVLTNTIFEGTKIDIYNWFVIYWYYKKEKRNINFSYVARILGIEGRTIKIVVDKLRAEGSRGGKDNLTRIRAKYIRYIQQVVNHCQLKQTASSTQ